MNAEETEDIESLFVEQAEYLEDAQFSGWSIQHPKEIEILRKLKASGAKLVIGPRGSGKTTLLLKSLNRMLSDEAGNVLPAYVNFKNSLRLEPIYKSNANASFWFNQWLYARTLDGIFTSLDRLGFTLAFPPGIEPKLLSLMIDCLQAGDIEGAKSALPSAITHSSFVDTVTSALRLSSRHRIVLLFDDAGHAFSPEEQRDFFDFFRAIKSSIVSPKAAIYPGITDFSSTFHSGHDAEEINIWMDPADDGYLEFMESMLKKRLPSPVFQQFAAVPEVLNLISFAAFGIPRNLLNMVRVLAIQDDNGAASSRRSSVSKTAAIKAIGGCTKTTLLVFQSLKEKLPIYEKFIDQGNLFLHNASEAIKVFNRATTGSKSVTLAIPAPLAPEVKTLIAFFQYAGILRPRGNVSRGTKGTFDLFDIHFSLLIDGNAILATKSASLTEIVIALKKRNAHAFTRVTVARLLGTDQVANALPLMLPPCQICNTARISPSARFCLNCGAQLTLKSTFETAVKQDICVLPLTANRADSIRSQSSIKTVKDLLLDKDHKELLKVKMIGPVWASRIARYAEEFVE